MCGKRDPQKSPYTWKKNYKKEPDICEKSPVYVKRDLEKKVLYV